MKIVFQDYLAALTMMQSHLLSIAVSDLWALGHVGFYEHHLVTQIFLLIQLFPRKNKQIQTHFLLSHMSLHAARCICCLIESKFSACAVTGNKGPTVFDRRHVPI